MKKHEIIESVEIEKLIFGGSGLATAPDGRRIIISGGVLPGAIVDIRILKIKKSYIEGQVAVTRKSSPLERPIPQEWQLYGGCKWLPIPYDKQMEIKSEQISDAFRLISAQTMDTVFHPIVPSPQSEHYRNKVEFSWGKYISEREGVHDEYRFGFHVQGQFDRIENCWYCVLADDEVNQIFRDVDNWARTSGFDTYDPKRGAGFWRHLVIRQGKKTNQIMLIFSVNGVWNEKNVQISGSVESVFTEMVSYLSKKYPHIASVYFLENTGRADIVQGNPQLLYGDDTITEKLLGYTFAIQPKSFFQVNTLGAEKLYSSAIDLIQNKGGILLDLYAGTGTIGILLASHFSQVFSVELVTSASQDGSQNARRNHVSNMEFINAKVEDFAVDFHDRRQKADTIIVDPPRDGMHPDACRLIQEFGAGEIIYVSCNPSTLVRDLQILTGITTIDEGEENQKTVGKYRLTDVIPVDMFPHTHHIETIVRLERVDTDQKLEK